MFICQNLNLEAEAEYFNTQQTPYSIPQQDKFCCYEQQKPRTNIRTCDFFSVQKLHIVRLTVV